MSKSKFSFSEERSKISDHQKELKSPKITDWDKNAAV